MEKAAHAGGSRRQGSIHDLVVVRACECRDTPDRVGRRSTTGRMALGARQRGLTHGTKHDSRRR